MQSGSGSCPQGVSKGFVCFIIGTKFPYSFHLYDKEHKGLKAFGNSFGQALKVLTPRSVGASGKRTIPFSSRVTPFISMKAGFKAPVCWFPA